MSNMTVQGGGGGFKPLNIVKHSMFLIGAKFRGGAQKAMGLTTKIRTSLESTSSKFHVDKPSSKFAKVNEKMNHLAEKLHLKKKDEAKEESIEEEEDIDTYDLDADTDVEETDLDSADSFVESEEPTKSLSYRQQLKEYQKIPSNDLRVIREEGQKQLNDLPSGKDRDKLVLQLNVISKILMKRGEPLDLEANYREIYKNSKHDTLEPRLEELNTKSASPEGLTLLENAELNAINSRLNEMRQRAQELNTRPRTPPAPPSTPTQVRETKRLEKAAAYNAKKEAKEAERQNRIEDHKIRKQEFTENYMAEKQSNSKAKHDKKMADLDYKLANGIIPGLTGKPLKELNEWREENGKDQLPDFGKTW